MYFGVNWNDFDNFKKNCFLSNNELLLLVYNYRYRYHHFWLCKTIDLRFGQFQTIVFE